MINQHEMNPHFLKQAKGLLPFEKQYYAIGESKKTATHPPGFCIKKQNKKVLF